MSYTASITFELPSGGTYLAALAAAGTIHATFRDATGFTDYGQDQFEFVNATFPDGYRGVLFVYTGTLGADTDFNNVVIAARLSINPEDFENGQFIPDIKTKVDHLPDSDMPNTTGKLWVLDGSGNAIAPKADTDAMATQIGTSGNAASIGLAVDVAIAEANAAHNIVASGAYGNAALLTEIDGIPAATRDVSNSSPASGSFGESARNADAKAAVIQAQTDQFAFTVPNQVDANALTGGGGGSGPTLTEIRDAIITDHGDGSYLRNTEPPTAASIATAVWNALTSALTTAGSIGKMIVEYLTGIKSKTDLITTGNVTITSPVNADGSTIDIWRGDDYFLADGLSIGFVLSLPYDPTGGSVTLNIDGQDPIAGHIVDATHIYFEMAAAISKHVDSVGFTVNFTLVDGHKTTPIAGKVNAGGPQ